MSETAIVEYHACGWSGPGWLHISGLCHTCKGVLPLAFGDAQEYAEPCPHPRCVKYRGWVNGPAATGEISPEQRKRLRSEGQPGIGLDSIEEMRCEQRMTHQEHVVWHLHGAWPRRFWRGVDSGSFRERGGE